MKKITALLGALSLVLLLVLTGCSEPSALTKANDQKMDQANRLHEHQQMKPITYSIELENIIQRISVTNNPKQVGWVYLMAADGTPTARLPVRGKVTSGGKRLSRTETYMCPDSNSCGKYEAPDEMGAYGSSNPYIFFFTPNGLLVQWQGNYLYTSEPYKLNPATKTIEYTIDAEEMARVAQYKAQIEATPLDKAKGGQ